MNLDFTTINESDYQSNGASRKDPNRLECKPENGINNQYECYFRYLPYVFDTSKSMYSKNIVNIKNPLVQKDSITIDCPKSIGRDSFFHALDEVLKKRENAKVEQDITKEIRKYFSRWYQIHSVVYILTDPYKPDNVGKIKFYIYGSKIDKLIKLEQAGTQTKPKVQVFDMLNGKDFYYYATKQSQTYANYDSCRFLDQKPFTFYLDGAVHTVTLAELEAMKNGAETPLKTLLLTMTPKMDDYFYKEASDTELQKAANLLRIILSKFPVIFNETMNSCADTKFKEMIMSAQAPVQAQQAMPQPTYEQQQNFGMPQMSFQQTPVVQQPVAPVYQQTPVATAAPVAQQPVAPVAQQPVAPVYQQTPVVTQAPPSDFGFSPQPVAPVVVNDQPGFSENNAFQAAMANL